MLTNYGPLFIYLLSFPVMILTLFNFEIGLLFFISIVPIISLMMKINKQFPLNIVDLLMIFMVLGWFFRGKKMGEGFFKKSPLNFVILLVVVGSIIDLIRGYTFMALPDDINLIRLKAWKNYMILPLIYFISVNNIEKEKTVSRILVCVCFTMLAMDFNFYSTFRWLRSEHYSDLMRISGPIGYLGPNELGLFYSIYTFLLLGISYFVEDKKLKYLMLFVCACNFYPILFSYSRSAYLCALAGFLTLGLLKDRKLLVLLIVLVIFYSFILPRSVVERINMTFLEEGQISEEKERSSAIDVGGVELDTVGRKQLWDKAIIYFKQEPLLGIGFETFRHKEGWITHSLLMKILAEQGLVGMAIFIVFIFMIQWQSYRLFRHSKSKLGQGIGLGLFSSIILYLVGTLGGDTSLYYHFMAFLWLFIGIVASFNVHYVNDYKPVQAVITE